jgi:transposase
LSYPTWQDAGMNDEIYSSDLTSAQWQFIRPFLPKPSKRGRPPKPFRQTINAIFYCLRTGCQWRLLPKWFGPWQTVFGRFRRWRESGFWSQLHDRLRAYVREAAGKRSRPTACILDSQTIRSSDHAGVRGYDAAKKIKGRKRFVLVDTLGMILGLLVTTADVPERVGAQSLLSRVLCWFTWLRVMWVDGGFSGPEFAQWVRRQRPKLKVEVVPRLQETKGFKVLRRRWIVERTFGWLNKQRRLQRDHETTIDSAEAWVHIAMIRIMIRRLA